MSGGIITIREEMPYGKSQMLLKELKRRISSLLDMAKTTTEIQALRHKQKHIDLIVQVTTITITQTPNSLTRNGQDYLCCLVAVI